MGRPFELDVREFRNRVLQLAAARNTDSAVVVAALADVIALTAAKLEVEGHHLPFDDRMDGLLTRMKAEFHRTHLVMTVAGPG